MNKNTHQLGSPFSSPTLSTALFPSAAASGDPVSAAPPPESSAGRPGPSGAGSVEQASPAGESTSDFDVADWFEIDVASSTPPHQPAAAQNESSEADVTDGEPPTKKPKLSEQPSTPEDQIIPSQDTVPPSAPGKASKSETSTVSPDTPTPRADLANGTEVFLLDEQGNSVACSETVQPLGLHTLPVNRADPSSVGNLENSGRFQAPCIFLVLGRCPLAAAEGKWAYKIIPKNGIGPERVVARRELLVPVRFRPGDYVYYLEDGERWEAVVEAVEVLERLRRYNVYITRQGQSKFLVTDDLLDIYSGQGLDA